VDLLSHPKRNQSRQIIWAFSALKSPGLLNVGCINGFPAGLSKLVGGGGYFFIFNRFEDSIP
jgi:hypothetical protein